MKNSKDIVRTIDLVAKSRAREALCLMLGNTDEAAEAAKTRMLSYECGHCGLYHSLPVETAANILALIDSEATKRVKEFVGGVQDNLVTSHLEWGNMNLAQQIVSDTLTRFIGGTSQ